MKKPPEKCTKQEIIFLLKPMTDPWSSFDVQSVRAELKLQVSNREKQRCVMFLCQCESWSRGVSVNCAAPSDTLVRAKRAMRVRRVSEEGDDLQQLSVAPR